MRSYYVCTLRPNTLLLLLGEERKEKEDLNSSPALNKISYLSKRRGRRVADKPFNRRVLPGHSLYFGLFCLEGGRSVDVCPLRRKTEMGLSAAAAAAAAGMSGAIYYTDKASKRTPFNSCCIPQLLVGNSWKSLDPPRCFLSPPHSFCRHPPHPIPYIYTLLSNRRGFISVETPALLSATAQFRFER